MEREKSRKTTGSLKGIIIIRMAGVGWMGGLSIFDFRFFFFWNNDRRQDQARKVDEKVERENYGSRRKLG